MYELMCVCVCAFGTMGDGGLWSRVSKFIVFVRGDGRKKIVSNSLVHDGNVELCTRFFRRQIGFRFFFFFWFLIIRWERDDVLTDVRFLFFFFIAQLKLSRRRSPSGGILQFRGRKFGAFVFIVVAIKVFFFVYGEI